MMISSSFSPSCSVVACGMFSASPSHSPRRYISQHQTLTLSTSHFLSSNSSKQSFSLPVLPRTRNSKPGPVVFAAQSNFFRVVQTVWKVGQDGIEAGTNLVPDSVPRPIARVAVTVAALAVSLFVMKSFLSTVFFVLGTMGLAYFIFLALNKDQGPRGGTGTNSSDDPLEEARRIMEKYK